MTKVETRVQRALNAIDAAIAALDLELLAPARSIDSPEGDLLDFRTSLVQMRESLEARGNGPEVVGYGRVIIESWPMNAPLGIILLKAENEYAEAWGALARSQNSSGGPK